MQKIKWKYLYSGLVLFVAFWGWTFAVKNYDVSAIGPLDSSVGLAKLNSFIHELTGANMWLYIITDWLSIIPFCVASGFGCLGVIQWIKRKKIQNVDYSLLVLGCFYIVVFGLYFLFEVFVVNYRPILINGVLEASYPSSTTMLVMTVMPTADMQLRSRIKSLTLSRIISCVIIVFSGFMVIGRVLSGVHWITDIIGGMLLAGAVVFLYRFMIYCKSK